MKTKNGPVHVELRHVHRERRAADADDRGRRCGFGSLLVDADERLMKDIRRSKRPSFPIPVKSALSDRTRLSFRECSSAIADADRSALDGELRERE